MLPETIQAMFPGIDMRKECLVVDDGKGPYIGYWNRVEKQPTLQEIMDRWPSVRERLLQEEADKQVADEQQRLGIVEAKQAHQRLQVIINNLDTATIVQLRAAVKQMARDMQHLIHAAVR